MEESIGDQQEDKGKGGTKYLTLTMVQNKSLLQDMIIEKANSPIVLDRFLEMSNLISFCP